MQIIQPNFSIAVVRSVSERINRRNLRSGGVLRYCRNAPSIVRVFRYRLRILINDGNNVALQILNEIVGNIIVENTANAVLVIVERNERVVPPSLTENLSAVKRVGVENAVTLFARSDAVDIVGLPLVSVSS